MESPFLEVFERHVDMALRDVVWWWTCSIRWIVGRDHKGLFQPKRFYFVENNARFIRNSFAIVSSGYSSTVTFDLQLNTRS